VCVSVFIPLDFQGLSGTHWTPPSKEEALFQSSGFVCCEPFVCVCGFRSCEEKGLRAFAAAVCVCVLFARIDLSVRSSYPGHPEVTEAR
jgi:hypothetical protein